MALTGLAGLDWSGWLAGLPGCCWPAARLTAGVYPSHPAGVACLAGMPSGNLAACPSWICPKADCPPELAAWPSGCLPGLGVARQAVWLAKLLGWQTTQVGGDADWAEAQAAGLEGPDRRPWLWLVEMRPRRKALTGGVNVSPRWVSPLGLTVPELVGDEGSLATEAKLAYEKIDALRAPDLGVPVVVAVPCCR